METTDLAKYLSDFFTKYLPGECNVSYNTILAYKEAFVQLINFKKEQKGIAGQKLMLEKINKEAIIDFLIGCNRPGIVATSPTIIVLPLFGRSLITYNIKIRKGCSSGRKSSP